MRIITDMDLPLKGGCVLSLGNFDGVHIGHTALLEAACKKAKELGLPSVVWTFGEAPLNVLRGKSSLKYITGSSDKIRLLSAVGCDAVPSAPPLRSRMWIPRFGITRGSTTR